MKRLAGDFCGHCVVLHAACVVCVISCDLWQSVSTLMLAQV